MEDILKYKNAQIEALQLELKRINDLHTNLKLELKQANNTIFSFIEKESKKKKISDEFTIFKISLN